MTRNVHIIIRLYIRMSALALFSCPIITEAIAMQMNDVTMWGSKVISPTANQMANAMIVIVSEDHRLSAILFWKRFCLITVVTWFQIFLFVHWICLQTDLAVLIHPTKSICKLVEYVSRAGIICTFSWLYPLYTLKKITQNLIIGPDRCRCGSTCP